METIEKSKWKALFAEAKAGDARAQWEVGYLYEQGVVGESGRTVAEQDFSKALMWHTLSAKQGNPDAQLSISNLLSSGDGVARDFPAAIKWAKAAIAQGNTSAAYNLGIIYRDLNKPTLAFRCYQKALAMGDKNAALQIGLCYLFGFGVAQNEQAAKRSFQEILDANPISICQQDIEKAHIWLALLQLLGSGNTKKSVTTARNFLLLANADDDHEFANDLLNVIGRT